MTLHFLLPVFLQPVNLSFLLTLASFQFRFPLDPNDIPVNVQP